MATRADSPSRQAMNTRPLSPQHESVDEPLGKTNSRTNAIDLSAPVDVQLLGPDSLSGYVEEKWSAIRNANPVFKSPYFDIKFTKAVARVRNDVRIAIAQVGEEIVSILPFQENKPGHAVPVGGLLNDWHGMMGKQDPDILQQIMKAADLRSFKFHAINAKEDSLKKYYFREFDSHYLDLSCGWEEYRKWVHKNSSAVKRQGQKTRALARNVGELRFEFESESANQLERLIELKRARYNNSNTFDILGVTWASNLLRELHQVRDPNFRGVLSILWAGDQLVGAHFGMLTDETLHYWFPVYAPAFHKYSPGTEMLMQSAQHACEIGIKKLDLGYGDDAYKYRFCNASEPVAFGMANFSPFSRVVAKYRYSFRNQLKQIPMKPLVKRILRKLYPRFGGWNFR